MSANESSQINQVFLDYELPHGWLLKNLRDVVSHKKGKLPRKLEETKWDGSVPYIDINAFERGKVDRYSDKESAVIVQKGDLLVVWDGARCGLVGKASYEGSLGSTLMTLKPLQIDSNFLFFVLRSYLKNINTNPRGTGIPHVEPDIFWNLEIPVPPLSEQRRIVAAIEVHFTRLDACANNLTTGKEKLKKYSKSVLKSAFEGRLTQRWRETNADKLEHASILLQRILNQSHNVKVRRDVPKFVKKPTELLSYQMPPSWELISIAKLLNIGALLDVKDGNHGVNHPKLADFSNEGLPFITASQVKDFALDYVSAPKISGAPLKRLKVGFSHSGDVILTHKGSVGRIGISTEDSVLSPQATYYRPNEAIDAHYLAYALASPMFQLQLIKIKSQTTRDFVPVRKQYALFIPMTNVIEQKHLAKVIEHHFSIINSSGRIISNNLKRVEALQPSILKIAFEGKLVAQDPNDEPADKLLEQIRMSKAILTKRQNSKVTGDQKQITQTELRRYAE